MFSLVFEKDKALCRVFISVQVECSKMIKGWEQISCDRLVLFAYHHCLFHCYAKWAKMYTLFHDNAQSKQLMIFQIS